MDSTVKDNMINFLFLYAAQAAEGFAVISLLAQCIKYCVTCRNSREICFYDVIQDFNQLNSVIEQSKPVSFCCIVESHTCWNFCDF